MAEAALLVVLLIGLVVPLALYLLVQRETRGRQEMSRADAAAYARERASERYGPNERSGRHEQRSDEPPERE